MVPTLKRTAPSQRIQIITSVEMLDEILGHLNTYPNICKILFAEMLGEMLDRLNRSLARMRVCTCCAFGCVRVFACCVYILCVVLFAYNL